MGKKLKKLAPLAIITILMAAAWVSGLLDLANFDNLQSHKDSIRSWAAVHSFLAPAVFFGLYTAAVALSLPVATLLTLLGGFLFGKWWGTLLVVTAATIGATIIFLVAGSALGENLRSKAGVAYQKVEQALRDNAAGYLLFMRLVPVFPFWFVNIAPAIINVPLRIYVLTTFFGIIPGTFVFVNVGEELGAIDNPGDIVSPRLLGAFLLLGLFALIPAMYNQWKKRKTA